MSKHRTGGDMKGMAKQISNQLSKLRSKHMFKMSRMQGQSKINFKRKKTNLSSEVNFSKYKNQETSQGKVLEKKSTFGQYKDNEADHSNRIYSMGSFNDLNTDGKMKDQNKIKTEKENNSLNKKQIKESINYHLDQWKKESRDNITENSTSDNKKDLTIHIPGQDFSIEGSDKKAIKKTNNLK